LGEVSFYLGDFSAAEQYFLKAQQKNAARSGEEFKKAAEARLMLGDLAGADALYKKSGAAVFEQARWEFLTGRRKSAMARLQQLIPTLTGGPKSLALSQLSIWKVQTGAASATEARLDVYALLFAGRFREATPKLEAIYRETNPTTDGQVRTVLAWAYVETKRIAEARDLVRVYPIPLSSGNPLFASLAFPRFLEVRGAVLQNEGKVEEAKKCQESFAKYSGDVRDAFR
jgi:tetratricopeptide (TPR) repeat protein